MYLITWALDTTVLKKQKDKLNTNTHNPTLVKNLLAFTQLKTPILDQELITMKCR